MKKIIAFLTFLLCVSFTEISAQQTVRWEVHGNTSLEIRVNGAVVVDSRSSNFNSQFPAYGPQNGVLYVSSGAYVEVIAHNTSGNSSASLEPMITEDDEWMIANNATEYNFTNEDDTSLYEYFIMPVDIPMYVRMSS